MSKALFVQKKIAHGRTDRQTDRHRDSINYIGIGIGIGIGMSEQEDIQKRYD